MGGPLGMPPGPCRTDLRDLPHLFCRGERSVKTAVYEQESLIRKEPARTLISDFPACSTVRNKFRLFISHLACGIIIAAQTHKTKGHVGK